MSPERTKTGRSSGLQRKGNNIDYRTVERRWQRDNNSLVEIGWVVAGRLERIDQMAVQEARSRMWSFLREHFPQFEWQMPLIHRKEVESKDRIQPVTLLDYGIFERESHQWDFALVITDIDLQAYYKPFSLAAPARSYSVAALSTARLDPESWLEITNEKVHVETMARRVCALALHLFGHLNDLSHTDDRGDVMFDLEAVNDLDRMERFSEENMNQLQEGLEHVADIRLEEQAGLRSRTLMFYWKAVWHNRMDILGAVLQIRPWRFPFYLSKLTTAAISALLIMVITAEAWDLGMNQSAQVIIVLSIIALLGTSVFIIKRQHLLMRTRTRRLSEQRVISNVSVTISIIMGMATTYFLLFAVTLLISRFLFTSVIIEKWAVSTGGAVHTGNYLVLSGFFATLGIIIGALGASFEVQSYIKHIAMVDEEI